MLDLRDIFKKIRCFLVLFELLRKYIDEFFSVMFLTGFQIFIKTGKKLLLSNIKLR
jgi:hypothetical protein